MDFDHFRDHPDDLLSKNILKDEYDPKLIQQFMDCLTPENAIYIVQS